jgi:hypothetical protein
MISQIPDRGRDFLPRLSLMFGGFHDLTDRVSASWLDLANAPSLVGIWTGKRY